MQLQREQNDLFTTLMERIQALGNDAFPFPFG